MMIVSINSPSGEGGGPFVGQSEEGGCLLVSINSPSGEGGGFLLRQRPSTPIVSINSPSGEGGGNNFY